MSIRSKLLDFKVGHIARLLSRYSEYVGSKKEKTYYPQEQQKSKRRILLDQFQNIVRFGSVEDYYYNYGHDRASSTDMSNYMLEPVHVKILSEANAHPYGKNVSWEKQFDYKALVRDKYLFALMMEGFSLPAPTTIGLIDGDDFYVQAENRVAKFNEILNYDMNVMLKPATGNGGIGMHHITINNGEIIVRGNKLDIDELKSLLNKKERYLVQDFVTEQHPEMASLFPGSINTLRVTMVRDDNEEIHLLGVMCLMGAGDMIVSNWHYGGVIINVKPDGYLNEYGYSNSLKRINKHPDTGIVFKDFKVPFYEKVIDISFKAMKCFYGLKTLGWDIAITPDGPIFIEGNDMWGMPAHQMVEEKGWREYYINYFNYKK